MLPASLLRRFRPLRVLGVGGGGTVYLVDDLVGPPSPKALKLVRRRGRDTEAAMLAREFDAMRKLRHPGLVEVFDFGQDRSAGVFWFSLEYVPGPDLHEASAGWGSGDLAEGLATLARTLAFLHGRGVLHNDLKPSNVRVPGGPGSPKLLDFGLASVLGSGRVAGGTPEYMAPERLGRPNAQGSVAADLFSLGAVFYRAATRRHAFEGADDRALAAAVSRGPIPPRALRPDLSPAIERSLLRLLEASPERRFASAADLLAALERDGGRTGVVPATLPMAPLVGRESAMQRLGGARQAAKAGRMQAVVLLGEAGMGKSRLLRELRQESELDGAMVVAVRVARGALRPWALVADLSRGLAGLAPSPPLPPPLAALAGRTPAGDSGETPPGEVGAAFAAYLFECASAPVVAVVDDLSWADPESVDLILDLCRRGPLERPLLVAATVREEDGAGPFVQRCREARMEILALAPLGDLAQRALLSALIPGAELPPALVDDAVAQAAGNPLALEEIVRLWLDRGYLRSTGGRWHLAEGGAAPAGGRPIEIIRSRLQMLVGGEARVLQCVAARGAALPVPVLSALVTDAGLHLARLRERGLLEDVGGGVDVRHPLVREAALSIVPEADLRAIHGDLVQALSAHGAPPEDLWLHEIRAGHLRAGLEHAAMTTRRAADAEDYRTGRQILEEVLGAPDAEREWEAMPVGARLDLELAFAECLLNTGDADRAADRLESVLALAPPERRSEVLVRLAWTAWHCAGRRDPTTYLDRIADSEQSTRWATEAAYRRLVFASEERDYPRAIRILDGLLPGLVQLGEDPRAARLAVDAHLTAGLVLLDSQGEKAALPHVEAAERLARKHGLGGRALYARVHRAAMQHAAGRLDDALALLDGIERPLASVGNPRLWVSATRLRAMVLRDKGRSAEALRLLESIAGSGVPPARLVTRCILSELLADLGDPRSLPLVRTVVREYRAVGRSQTGIEHCLGGGARAMLWTGDRETLSDLEDLLVQSASGASPGERVQIEEAKGNAAAARGAFPEAVEHLGQAVSGARDLLPLVLPRALFHLAYALGKSGQPDDASRACAEAARLWEERGNMIEAARAGALAAAIDSGRFTASATAADWLRRMRAALAAELSAGDPVGALASAVAGAARATACWVVALSAEGAVELKAAAGPCAGGQPLAWTAAIREAVEEGRETPRPASGLTLPVSLSGSRLALVVEDRAFPCAFSAEAAELARAVTERALDSLAARQVTADLQAQREALAQRSPGAPRPEATSITSDGRTLMELTVGPLVLRHSFGGIVTRSEPMRRVLAVVDRVVDLDAPVLLTGETGTGKELIARLLHEQGPRAAGPFVAVNCSAIPATLAESEFFGNVPGAFTGAGRTRHAGYFEQASGGTLFLDELGEMDPQLQTKLLRALEEGEIQPLGSDRRLKVDVRVVAATNRDLRGEVARERFRADLFYRLAVVELRLPPLRERRADIPDLVGFLLKELSGRSPPVAPDALDALCAYAWPGNIRELRNELERALALCGDGEIRRKHFSHALRPDNRVAGGLRGRSFREATIAFQKQLITDALRASSGVKAKAARALGLSPVALHLRMTRLGMHGRKRGRSRLSRATPRATPRSGRG